MPRPPLLLLAGISTRALAQSVRRSGFRGRLAALDYFGDEDQERLCRSLVLGQDHPGRASTAALLRAIGIIRPRSVMFTGGMENHPRLLAEVERRVRVLGNSSRAVRAAGDPFTFFGCLERQDLPHPRTWIRPVPGGRIPPGASALAREGRLLWKPRHGGGGVRIRLVARARSGSNRARGGVRHRSARPAMAPAPAAPGPLPRGGYLQEWIRGAAGSVSFVANGQEARILGYCQALSREPLLGAPGFAYTGSLLGPARSWLSAGARRILRRAVASATRVFRLCGLNGLDFVLRHGRPLLLEINPRYTASMELIEEACGRSLFVLHREACSSGTLPEAAFFARRGARGRTWIGKGIVYACRTTRIDSLQPFLEVPARDIPRPGTIVRSGWPLCTVMGAGRSAGECRRSILGSASRLRRSLAVPGRMRRAS
ncbi:MAG: ATP-grasp domain-containing protein [Acidobacteriota bacterium]